MLAKLDVRLEIRDKKCRDTVLISDGRRTPQSIQQFRSDLHNSRDEGSEYGELTRSTDPDGIE